MACLCGIPSARYRGALHTSHAVNPFLWAVNATQPARQQTKSFFYRSTLESIMELRAWSVRQVPEKRRWRR